MIESQAIYSEEEFTELDLSGRELSDSEFYDCVFKRSSFLESSLMGCRFTDSSFVKCDLSLMQVDGCTFSRLKIIASKVIGVNWVRADWSSLAISAPIKFEDCSLNHSTFLDLKLPDVIFKDCLAQEVDFRGANLSGARFDGTDLSNALFHNTNLTGADLSRARNYQISPQENDLKDARFALPEALSLLHHLDIELIDNNESAT